MLLQIIISIFIVSAFFISLILLGGRIGIYGLFAGIAICLVVVVAVVTILKIVHSRRNVVAPAGPVVSEAGGIA